MEDIRKCLYGGSDGKCGVYPKAPRQLCHNHYYLYSRQVKAGSVTWEWLESQQCCKPLYKPNYDNKIPLLLELAKGGADNWSMAKVLGMKYNTFIAWKRKLRDRGIEIPAILGRKKSEDVL